MAAKICINGFSQRARFKKCRAKRIRIDKDYSFDTDKGKTSLADLFRGRSQLVVYHFMFGPGYTAGCPACSATADSFNGVLPHLEARDVTMICISRAPIEKLLAFRRRMGWSFNWASSYGNDFNTIIPMVNDFLDAKSQEK